MLQFQCYVISKDEERKYLKILLYWKCLDYLKIPCIPYSKMFKEGFSLTFEHQIIADVVFLHN